MIIIKNKNNNKRDCETPDKNKQITDFHIEQ